MSYTNNVHKLRSLLISKKPFFNLKKNSYERVWKNCIGSISCYHYSQKHRIREQTNVCKKITCLSKPNY